MKVEMDRPHIDETTRYYNQISSVLEPAGYEKKTKEYMEKRLGKG
jgi:hypothetical protein